MTEDNEEICQTGLDYFARKGFRRVAFAGVAETWHPRLEVFARLAQERGLEYSIFPADQASLATDFEQGMKGMRDWLRSLKPPLGILAFSEAIGTQLLGITRQLGMRSPAEFAVLGHGGGQLECELSAPPLSVIEADGRRVGREAALLLEQMLRGEPVPDDTFIQLPSKGITERLSTDVLGIDDELLRKALMAIRDHGCDGLTPEDLARQCGVSRRILEHRFKSRLGTSPSTELMRVRLNRVKELLRQTTLALPEICELTGFSYPSRLSEVFRRKIGMTTSEYRQSESSLAKV